MSVSKIVLAYDGSEDSKFALEWSKSYALQIGAEIAVTSVYDEMPALQAEAASMLIPFATAYANGLKKHLKEIEEEISVYEIAVSTILLKGNPPDEIIHYASQINADLIICGTRGLGGFSSLLLGSVAHKLVAYSPIPVLVVKRPRPGKQDPKSATPAKTL
ncbi:MAG: universal stress protein [Veillonellales bacterium]